MGSHFSPSASSRNSTQGGLDLQCHSSPRALSPAKLGVRLQQECDAKAPDLELLPALKGACPLLGSLSSHSSGSRNLDLPSPTASSRGQGRRAPNARARTIAFDIFPGWLAGRAEPSVLNFPASGGIGVALAPPPAWAPPSQVDGSGSWDCSGARPRRAAGSGRRAQSKTRAPDTVDPQSGSSGALTPPSAPARP